MTVTRRSNAFLHTCRIEIDTPLPMERVRAALATVTAPNKKWTLKGEMFGERPEKEYAGEIDGNVFTLDWARKNTSVHRARSLGILIDVACNEEPNGTRITLRVRQTPMDRFLWRAGEAVAFVVLVLSCLPYNGSFHPGLFALGALCFAVVYGRDVAVTSVDFTFATDNLLRALEDEESGRASSMIAAP